jgi:hypothetical protein
MRIFCLSVKIFLCFTLIAAVSCSNDKTQNKKTSGKKIIENLQGFCGWDSITLRNAFTRLDVVSELGGKIMGYEAIGKQILWHNTSYEGKTDIFLNNVKGQEYINPGGVKVWPYPKEFWQGPPDKIIEGSVYSKTIDENTITMTSPKDDAEGATGLQFVNKYNLIPRSTVLELNLAAHNVVKRRLECGINNIVTISSGKNTSIYVPVEKNEWGIISGDKDTTLWRGIKDGIFCAKYNGKSGKAGFKLSEGWAVVYDEENSVAFAMLFPTQKNDKRSGKNNNFEILMESPKNDSLKKNNILGYTELSFFSQIAKLSSGDSSTVNIKWGSCRCTGVKRVTPISVISEEIVLNNETVTGKFGVFYAGTLEEYFVDKDGNMKGRNPVSDVSPLSEVIYEHKIIIPLKATAMRLQIVGYDHKLIGVIKEIKITKENIIQKKKK